MVGQSTDGWAVGPCVVVHHDDHRAVTRRDVVEGFPRHAAGQSSIADHRYHVALGCDTPKGPCFGDSVGVRQGGGGMGILDDVVRALRPTRVAG